MWVRAVWIEGMEQIEDAIPKCWVENDVVRWPCGVTFQKQMDEMLPPSPNWRTFTLVKVKFESRRLHLFIRGIE